MMNKAAGIVVIIVLLLFERFLSAIGTEIFDFQVDQKQCHDVDKTKIYTYHDIDNGSTQC